MSERESAPPFLQTLESRRSSLQLQRDSEGQLSKENPNTVLEMEEAHYSNDTSENEIHMPVSPLRQLPFTSPVHSNGLVNDEETDRSESEGSYVRGSVRRGGGEFELSLSDSGFSSLLSDAGRHRGHAAEAPPWESGAAGGGMGRVPSLRWEARANSGHLEDVDEFDDLHELTEDHTARQLDVGCHHHEDNPYLYGDHDDYASLEGSEMGSQAEDDIARVSLQPIERAGSPEPDPGANPLSWKEKWGGAASPGAAAIREIVARKPPPAMNPPLTAPRTLGSFGRPGGPVGNGKSGLSSGRRTPLGSSVSGMISRTGSAFARSSNTRSCANQTEPVISNSFLVFTANNKFRKVMQEWTDHSLCEKFVLAVVLVSCFSLAAKDPSKPMNTGTNYTLEMIDLAALVVFTVEMLAKMLAWGIIIDEQSYLRDGWNVLDFLVVVLSLIDLGVGAGNTPLKPIRLMRSLKSLRLLKRFEQLRMLVETIIASFPALGSVVIVLGFYLTFMGMLGVQFFKGSFHHGCYLAKGYDPEAPADPSMQTGWLCSERDPPLAGSHTCDSHTEVCGFVPTNRNNGVTGFDNIGIATLTVFVATTLEGWSDLMYDLEDTRGSASMLYVFVVVFMGNFIIMNLALAVIFENYQEAKALSLERVRRAKVEHELLMNELAQQESADVYKKELDEKVMKRAMSVLRLDDFEQQSEKPKHAGGAVVQRFKYFRRVMAKRMWLKRRDGRAEDPKAMKQSASRSALVQQQQEEFCCCCFPTPTWWLEFRTKYLLPVVNRGEYTFCVMLVVFVNVIALCTETADMDDAGQANIEIINAVCTWIFTGECFFHAAARGLRTYLSDFMNVFDFAITVVTLTEMAFVLISGGGSQGAFSAFRAIRILRIFKLAKSWKSLQKFLLASAKAAEGSVHMLLLMLLFMFVFAIMGRDLFAGKLSEGSRPYYDNIFWSFITTFQVISGENWNDVMYETVGSIGWGAMPYILLVYILGNILLMNLFISILIDTFVQTTGEMKEEKDATRGQNQEDGAAADASPARMIGAMSRSFVHRSNSNSLLVKWHRRIVVLMETEQEVSNSVCLFSLDHPVRRVLVAVVSSSAFEQVILLLILVSTVTTIMDTYSETSPEWLDHIGTTLAFLFLIEMLIKILAMGLLFGKDTYLRDSWNVIDCFTTVMSLVSLQFPALVWARALRSVRPLRIINRIKSFRIITSSIVFAMKESSTIGAMALIFWVLLSVFGMQLFLGTFSVCSDPDVIDREECVGAFTDASGQVDERRWEVLVNTHFDNIFNAMLATFEVATLEMWPNIMYYGVDIRGVGKAMDSHSNRSSVNALYFVLVVLVFGFFIINLFVGIVMDTFNSFKMENEERDWSPSWAGEEWLDTEKELMKLKPFVNVPRPKNRLRAWFHKISSSSTMEVMVNLLILLTFLVSCMEHYKQPGEVSETTEVFNMVANILFAMEIMVKLTGFGPWYFHSMWNRFDFVTTCVTLFFAGSAFSSMRVVRFVRVFRVLHTLKGFRMLVSALVVSLPGIMQAAGVLLLVLMMYAITGVYLFRDVVYGQYLNKHANFENFTLAMITLFRCATGESYNAIMHELAVQPPDCSVEAGDCGSYAAFPFMLTFVLLVQMILLNMFIAVTLSSYTDVSMSESRLINGLALLAFNRAWEKVDPVGIGYVHVSLIADFLFELPEPYGLKSARSSQHERRSIANLIALLRKLRLNMSGEMLDYRQVLLRLMAHVYIKLQSIPLKDEESRWLLGRVNETIMLREKKMQMRASRRKTLREGTASVSEVLERAVSVTSENFDDISFTKQESKIFVKWEVFKDYVMTKFFAGSPFMSEESKIRTAKADHRQSAFYFGPSPPGSAHLRTVEFYFALQVVAYHSMRSVPVSQKDSTSRRVVDPMLDNGLGELGRHNASFEEDCIRSYHELEKKHKAEPRQYAGDQISRQLEYRKQEISKQVYFDEHLKDVEDFEDVGRNRFSKGTQM